MSAFLMACACVIVGCLAGLILYCTVTVTLDGIRSRREVKALSPADPKRWSASWREVLGELKMSRPCGMGHGMMNVVLDHEILVLGGPLHGTWRQENGKRTIAAGADSYVLEDPDGLHLSKYHPVPCHDGARCRILVYVGPMEKDAGFWPSRKV